jgi:hypothetical protein
MNPCVPPDGATGLGVGPRERNLWRERLRGHNLTICNTGGNKRHQNPTVAGRCYTPFSLPKIC